jgi:hypothetical protein
VKKVSEEGTSLLTKNLLLCASRRVRSISSTSVPPSLDKLLFAHSQKERLAITTSLVYYYQRASILVGCKSDRRMSEEYNEAQLRLITVWDAHCKAEFADANVEDTMATMIQESEGGTVPFVNHVPTMTGGYTLSSIESFYSKYFLCQMPKDTETKLVSRTVGRTQIVDEMIFSFTHDIEMAWMLPKVKPTMKKVEVPLVAIIGFENEKVSFERIYWDQASVLVQIGMLGIGQLPITGVEQTRKVQDPSLPSNTLM